MCLQEQFLSNLQKVARFLFLAEGICGVCLGYAKHTLGNAERGSIERT